MISRAIATVPTKLGATGIGFSEGKVARLWLPGAPEKTLMADMRRWAGRRGPTPIKATLTKNISAYFEGSRVEFDCQVDLSHLCEFHQRILRALKDNVKWGQVITYSQLAKLAGHPNAARAVGSAMTKNPIPLIIPCHRVIRADGKLGKFSGPGGAKQKRAMLKLEKAYPK